jgi:hypothetical protein
MKEQRNYSSIRVWVCQGEAIQQQVTGVPLTSWSKGTGDFWL